jgi:hypothetical protein
LQGNFGLAFFAENIFNMKAIIIALLAAFTGLGCMAETAINLVDSSQDEWHRTHDDPRRMPPVIPTAWFDGGTVYIHTTLPSQNVSVEITGGDGIVAVQQITTGSDRLGRVDGRMLMSGESYILSMIIGSR